MSRLMKWVDRLAERLTRIHADWLLYAVWLAALITPYRIPAGRLAPSHALLAVLLLLLLPSMTLVCQACLKERHRQGPDLFLLNYWYRNGRIAWWILTVITLLVLMAELAGGRWW
ncbi:hypothetical protein [Bifidobacterium stellenboschense]|uniref:Uncharacterized protein n=1 Tax=Bifidobacterium stellenboschense TaxID=762211 RepID=A0A087DKS3_9BIFI|nr:hypothetical protein [Bifidobacterium stellenboschense]KFI96123.1 hypothetical protein BSTEL_1156 [Bifidobacterium stellenboschense]